MKLTRLLLPLFLLLIALPGYADDNPEKAPADAKSGKVFVWHSEAGVPYEYYVPKSYDPEKGANLTVVLHGNGLDHRWTFWNHPAGEFRDQDIVVSPDAVSEINGNREFIQSKEEVDGFKALLQELKAQWNIRQTFLYGHSQGSFFVFLFAGEHPEEVDGVCGHASGSWIGTQYGKPVHDVAIGIMHGTDDHLSYSQSWYTRQTYEEAKHPMVHLRTLFDWPHRPNYYQAQSVIDWCEGMTTTDPERLTEIVEGLSDTKRPMGVDWSGLWQVSNRLAEMDGATPKQSGLGKRVAEAVDALSAKHIAKIEKGAPKGKLNALDGKPWAGHLIRLHEDFRGVPSFDAFRKKHKSDFKKLDGAPERLLKDYWRKKDSDKTAALTLGLDLLSTGFLNYQCVEIAGELEATFNDRKKLKLPKSVLKRERLIENYRSAREKGFKDFESLNKKAKL
ncbi:MAG: alpha/beta hydrolase [Planctomycetota bacterium]